MKNEQTEKRSSVACTHIHICIKEKVKKGWKCWIFLGWPVTSHHHIMWSFSNKEEPLLEDDDEVKNEFYFFTLKGKEILIPANCTSLKTMYKKSIEGRPCIVYTLLLTWHVLWLDLWEWAGNSNFFCLV